MNSLQLLCSLSVAAAALANPCTAARKEFSFTIVLKPVADASGQVSGIAVHQEIKGVAPSDGAPLRFSAPVTYAAVTDVADRIGSLVVNDAYGLVTLAAMDDSPAPGGFPYFRRWRASREVKFPVTVDYIAQVQPPGAPGGPPFGIRPSGGGVSGSGGGFLLLPDNGGTTVNHLRWDLSGLPKGSVGATSFGEGAVDLPGPPEVLTGGWIMAGPAHRYSAPRGIKFSAFWLGEPPFEADAAMAWAAKAYSYLGKSFGYLKPVPDYRVFMRVLDTPPVGSGTALSHSFMLSMGKDGPRGDMATLRTTLFHEMTHQWVGYIEGRQGVIAWFEEGLTVYYTTVLPVRGGLVSVDDYGKLLNEQARQYYQGKSRNWSAARIAGVGFGDEGVRHTPYVRGALYFSDLDWKIRAHSHGKRNLDAFLHPMFVSRLAGARFDQKVWEEMLSAELGPEAVADFRAELIDGTQTVVPESGAFGPGFAREKVQQNAADGSMVDGYQWKRVAGVPDEKCRAW